MRGEQAGDDASRGLSCHMKIVLLQQGGGEPPRGDLLKAIESEFQSVGKLIELMNAEGAGVQGSGWVVCSFFSAFGSLWRYCSGNSANCLRWSVQWLGLDKKLKRLAVATTANQVRTTVVALPVARASVCVVQCCLFFMNCCPGSSCNSWFGTASWY